MVGTEVLRVRQGRAPRRQGRGVEGAVGVGNQPACQGSHLARFGVELRYVVAEASWCVTGIASNALPPRPAGFG